MLMGPLDHSSISSVREQAVSRVSISMGHLLRWSQMLWANEAITGKGTNVGQSVGAGRDGEDNLPLL